MSEYYSYFDTTINTFDLQSEIKNIINSNKYVSPSEPPSLSTDTCINNKLYDTQPDFSFELSDSHFEPLIRKYKDISTDDSNDEKKIILNKIKIMSDDDELFC